MALAGAERLAGSPSCLTLLEDAHWPLSFTAMTNDWFGSAVSLMRLFRALNVGPNRHRRPFGDGCGPCVARATVAQIHRCQLWMVRVQTIKNIPPPLSPYRASSGMLQRTAPRRPGQVPLRSNEP